MSDAAQVVGYLIGAGVTIAAGIAGAMKARELWVAKVDRGIAEEGSARTVADANSAVYNRLIERLAAVEEDNRLIRHELAAVRRHVRHAEDHISALERAMRKSGIEPPIYMPFHLNDQH
jgi:acetylglutamate kinase